MRIYDITLTIERGMPVWPGDPPVETTLIGRLGLAGAANVSRLSMSVHTGTHVDAPIHFIAGGVGVEQSPLDALVGPCRVCEVHPSGLSIEAGDLDALNLPTGTQRLLIKTSNSQLWARPREGFQERFVSLSAGAARWVVEHGLRLVGVDYLSVESLNAAQPIVHHTLLRAGVVPLEGINLAEVAAGEYTLVCLPLKLAGSDGAPARVILIED